jgi:hypothetical protein
MSFSSPFLPETIKASHTKSRLFRELQQRLSIEVPTIDNPEYDDTRLQEEFNLLELEVDYLLSLRPPEEEEEEEIVFQAIHVDFDKFTHSSNDGLTWETAWPNIEQAMSAYKVLFNSLIDEDMTEAEEIEIMKKFPIWVKGNQSGTTDFRYFENRHAPHIKIYGGMKEEYESHNDRTVSDYCEVNTLQIFDFDDAEIDHSQTLFDGFLFTDEDTFIEFTNSDIVNIKFENCIFDLDELSEVDEQDLSSNTQTVGSSDFVIGTNSPFEFEYCTFRNLSRTYSINRVLAHVTRWGGKIEVGPVINTPSATFKNIIFDSVDYTINGTSGHDDQMNQEFYGLAPGFSFDAGDATLFYIDPVIKCSSMSNVSKVSCSLDTNAEDCEGGDGLNYESTHEFEHKNPSSGNPDYTDLNITGRKRSGRDGPNGGNSLFGRAGNGGNGEGAFRGQHVIEEVVGWDEDVDNFGMFQDMGYDLLDGHSSSQSHSFPSGTTITSGDGGDGGDGGDAGSTFYGTAGSGGTGRSGASAGDTDHTFLYNSGLDRVTLPDSYFGFIAHFTSIVNVTFISGSSGSSGSNGANGQISTTTIESLVWGTIDINDVNNFISGDNYLYSTS